MSYSRLSAVERGKIELLHGQGWSAIAISREIGRHHTTVSREIARNGISAVYKAETAQTRYVERRTVCRPRPRLAHAALRDYVVEKIAEEEWTPELVAGRLSNEFPEDPRMRICAESIYQAIYTNRYKLAYLVVFRPQARPKRRRRGQGKTRRGPCIPNRRSIHERPETVERRQEIGHWEGDLVVAKNQEGFIATLVERHSLQVVAVHMKTKHAPAVAEA